MGDRVKAWKTRSVGPLGSDYATIEVARNDDEESCSLMRKRTVNELKKHYVSDYDTIDVLSAVSNRDLANNIGCAVGGYIIGQAMMLIEGLSGVECHLPDELVLVAPMSGGHAVALMAAASLIGDPRIKTRVVAYDHRAKWGEAKGFFRPSLPLSETSMAILVDDVVKSSMTLHRTYLAAKSCLGKAPLGAVVLFDAGCIDQRTRLWMGTEGMLFHSVFEKKEFISDLS